MPVSAEEVARAAAEYVIARRSGKRRELVELRRVRMEALAGRFGTEQKLSTPEKVVPVQRPHKGNGNRTTQKHT